jgi:hypothetical protein
MRYSKIEESVSIRESMCRKGEGGREGETGRKSWPNNRREESYENRVSRERSLGRRQFTESGLRLGWTGTERWVNWV